MADQVDGTIVLTLLEVAFLWQKYDERLCSSSPISSGLSVCFIDAGLEVFGCQDEVYLVVNLPVRGIPGCCPRQLVGMDSVGKGESVALCSSVVLFFQCQIFLLSLPSVSTRQGPILAFRSP